MTKQDKLDAVKSLHKMIIELKSNPSVESKKTIQQLPKHTLCGIPPDFTPE